MITTNGNAETVEATEPKKLGIRTTEGIATTAPEPVTRGSDLSKIITTHNIEQFQGKKGKGGKVKKAE